MDFQIFVKPVGARCNLACDYCYYHSKWNNHREGNGNLMNASVLESYILQHLMAESGDTVMFSWHGGEPLLAGISFYREVLKLQEKYNTDRRRIVNGIQTNGILVDDKWCKFLYTNNFIVGLSIDGPQHLHDLHRIYGNGKPTFGKVNSAWKLLRSYGIIHELLCVVNSSNVDYPLEVYNYFSEGGAEYVTFLPLVEREGSEGVSVNSVDPLKFGEFLVVIFDKWKSGGIGKIKIQIFEEALRSAFGQDHTLCIFKKECGGVPLVEMDGNFYTCDHYADPGNLVGNVMDTTLSSLLSSSKQVEFGRNKEVSLPLYCRNCEVLNMCNGECPRNRFINTPGGEPGLNYLCRAYRMFFNHVRPFAGAVSDAWKSRSL